MADTYRLFIAIEVPEAIRNYLHNFQTDLKKDLSGKHLRWVNPENIHLTLRFLGDTPVDHLPAYQRALNLTASKHKTFSLLLDGPGYFPNANRPRVLWIGLGGEVPLLRNLQSDLENNLKATGVEPDRKGFSPHLTLCRIKDREASPQEIAAIDSSVKAVYKKPNADDSWRVSEIALIKSDLHPHGAMYTPLYTAQLRDNV